MSDDIVTRLRMQADVADGFPLLRAKDSAMTSWVREAADEIERLRADRDRWRKVADVCVMAIGVPENDIDRVAVRHYDEAVRGD